ncbi:MAG: tRNA (N(6)-L-threonylcarbamoyladenosine(37)-C(2))-methylthiotransferase MtaB [Anaerolineales bacterium]|nr:MAG: tRNA (N(6)-L-threonylcarbamoyladenosine(37)-C(2))-methylthiotransferase MtaB [Anaerolineales bacterium]
MKVYLQSLGCKLNQSELESLACQFVQAGHTVVDTVREADLCVLNTCAVTQTAVSKSRQAIRRLRRANSDACLAVTGCYAQMWPQEIRELGSVDLIVGNEYKEHLVERAEKELGIKGPGSERAWVPSPDSRFPIPQARTRAFVKIQDGCDNHCTYCIVRVARGRQRSRPRRDVLAEVEARVAVGYQEVVLTGVHIGAYGRDSGRQGDESLWALVEAILMRTNVRRLRLSSIEPWDLAPACLRLWEDSRLCRHLHLPLQSGCDATLQRMGRGYTAGQFAALVEAAREAIPGVAITTDVIVGFPGESEAEFNESLRFVKAMGFARTHVFKYSARSGTPAATMPGQVSPLVKKARSRAIMEVSRHSAEAFRRAFLGCTLEVLWEAQTKGSELGQKTFWSGLTDNYLRVRTQEGKNLSNTITRTKLVALVGDGMWGKVCEEGRCVFSVGL